jgi:hypothetical protein
LCFCTVFSTRPFFTTFTEFLAHFLAQNRSWHWPLFQRFFGLFILGRTGPERQDWLLGEPVNEPACPLRLDGERRYVYLPAG